MVQSCGEMTSVAETSPRTLSLTPEIRNITDSECSLISPAKPTVPSDSGNITEETVASNKDEGSNAVPTTAGTVDDRKGAAASNTVTDVNAGEVSVVSTSRMPYTDVGQQKVPKSDLAQPNAKDMPLSRAITGEDDDWEILESVAEGPKEKLPEWMLIDFGWQLEVIWPGRRRCLPGVHSR